MKNKPCPYCGAANLPTDTVCKRCRAALETTTHGKEEEKETDGIFAEAGAAYETPPEAAETESPTGKEEEQWLEK